MTKPSDLKQKNKKNTKQKQSVIRTTKPDELGGPKGLEPTRYGDWESKGRCIDF